jgi:hypothetical protein
MATVNLTSEFGLVVRRVALEQRGVSYRELLDAMESEAPLDVNEDLISFGPQFGWEAATEFVRRLESLGLRNIDDFFVFTGDFPEWCGFAGFLKRALPPTS